MRTLADPASQIKCPANVCEDMLSVRAFLLTASLRTERLDIVFPHLNLRDGGTPEEIFEHP